MFIQAANAYFLPLRSGWDSSLSWSFYTEVQTIFDGSEDRISLRPKPWEDISYKYTFPEKDSVKIKPFLTHYLRKDYLVPYFFIGSEVIGSAVWTVDDVEIYGVTFPAIQTGVSSSYPYQYDVSPYGSWVALYKGFDVVIKQVYPFDGLVTSNSLVSIAFGPDDDFDFTGWKICPLRLGKIKNNPEIATNKKYSSVTVEYAMIEEVEFFSETSSEVYQGIDVYKKCLLLAGDTLPFTHTKDIDVSSNNLGIRKYFSDWVAAYRSFDLRKVLADRSEFIGFLRWCMRRLGRYEPFWCPVYSTDFGLISVGDNSISVEYGDERLRTFAIYMEDGSFYLATASSFVKDGHTINYIFDQNFEAAPEKVYYAVQMRLSDDSVSFDFSLGGSRVTSSVAVRSII